MTSDHHTAFVHQNLSSLWHSWSFPIHFPHLPIAASIYYILRCILHEKKTDVTDNHLSQEARSTGPFLYLSTFLPACLPAFQTSREIITPSLTHHLNSLTWHIYHHATSTQERKENPSSFHTTINSTFETSLVLNRMITVTLTLTVAPFFFSWSTLPFFFFFFPTELIVLVFRHWCVCLSVLLPAVYETYFLPNLHCRVWTYADSNKKKKIDHQLQTRFQNKKHSQPVIVNCKKLGIQTSTSIPPSLQKKRRKKRNKRKESGTTSKHWWLKTPEEEKKRTKR